MKYCSNCGQPLREGVKVCTNCGTPVNQHHQSHSQPQYRQTSNHHAPTHNGNKKTWIIISIVAVIIIALIALFLILKSQLSPEKQASQIARN